VGILRDDGPGLIGVGFMSKTMVPRMDAELSALATVKTVNHESSPVPGSPEV
jgi:hypothetical protein